MSSPANAPATPSFSSYPDPSRNISYSNTPENNAWESFLVGKEGDTPPAKETSISYLDEFEMDSAHDDLLSRSAHYLLKFLCRRKRELNHICELTL